MPSVCVFFHICRKCLVSQGSVATCLRWVGYCHLRFVANFIRFPAVHKIWKSVKIWQSYSKLKGRNFLRHSVEYIVHSGFVDDVMFLRNCPYGVWHWQYLPERRVGASVHKFPMYSPFSRGATQILTLPPYMAAATCVPGTLMPNSITLSVSNQLRTN